MPKGTEVGQAEHDCVVEAISRWIGPTSPAAAVDGSGGARGRSPPGRWHQPCPDVEEVVIGVGGGQGLGRGGAQV